MSLQSIIPGISRRLVFQVVNCCTLEPGDAAVTAWYAFESQLKHRFLQFWRVIEGCSSRETRHVMHNGFGYALNASTP